MVFESMGMDSFWRGDAVVVVDGFVVVVVVVEDGCSQVDGSGI